ncbi:Ubiquitin carboxyl-terminal hydrolase 7 [Puccinia graminis f. sp. tritici]|uniref:Ubiquitin carboxyl-terminal hydrolase 7 n=1 Tax=Puccinia graminis f. sp. tritici TaxID=56615 RepID=A0A5B0RJ55_PUCGR|nr:Ubiquitin carboxyl-terminal hydrolase 7 [Puccinia graminis f. sp. tritici]
MHTARTFLRFVYSLNDFKPLPPAFPPFKRLSLEPITRSELYIAPIKSLPSISSSNRFRYISFVLRNPPSTLHLSLLVSHVPFVTKSILLIASSTYQDRCKTYLPLKSYQSITVAMTRTKRKHLLRALKREGPLPLGGPDRLTMGNSINRQGHKGACAVVQPALKTATCIDGRSESPLSLGNTDLLARRKANNHQGYKEACVVSLPINKDASLPATSPLPTSSPDILEKRQDNKPQLQKKRRAVSSSTARAMSHRVHKPRNPPPQYASATAKKIARAYRKLKPSDDSYFIICSPSKARVSRKPIINLPVLNKPPRQIVLSSSLAPHFIFETHSFDVSPPTPTFTKLCEVIETLHAMAKYRPCNKRNANRLNGEMHLIGFRPGNDRGKSAGTYARRTDLTPAQSAHDDTLWAKLQSFNKFLSQRMEAISHSAYQQNKELMNKRGIPNWSQEEWAEMRKEDQIEFQFASNVSVTFNDFYNKPHQDKKDINGWTLC